jgi:hypothetical protein
MPTLTGWSDGDVQTSVGKLNSSSSKASGTAKPLDFGNPSQNALEKRVPDRDYFVGVLKTTGGHVRLNHR